LCVCVLLFMGHVPDNKLIGLDWIGYEVTYGIDTKIGDLG